MSAPGGPHVGAEDGTPAGLSGGTLRWTGVRDARTTRAVPAHGTDGSQDEDSLSRQRGG